MKYHRQPKTRIAAFFFIDIVGLSKPNLPTDKQAKKISELNKAIKQCKIFKNQGEPRFILPTGDGMAIDFRDNMEGPINLAIELHQKLEKHNSQIKNPTEKINVRIGIHSGPVLDQKDILNEPNVWGDGIIFARRVMDLGDAGHILLSDKIANELQQVSSNYQGQLHPMGNYRIKHGEDIPMYSYYTEKIGNKEIPLKISPALEPTQFRLSEDKESLGFFIVDRGINEKQKLQRLKQGIEAGRIDQIYMYWEASASFRWETLCDSNEYQLHRISKELVSDHIDEIIKSITKDTKSSVFDFVNLGTGGGQKDVIILQKLLDLANGNKMRYFPLDQNFSMLSNAMQHVLPFFSDSQYKNLELSAILGDFTKLQRYKGIIRNTQNPKIFALLGITIGNFDELPLLTQIKNFMTPNDVLILDADLIGDRDDNALQEGYDIKPVLDLMVHPIVEHLSDQPDLVKAFSDSTVRTEVNRNNIRIPNSAKVQVYLLANNKRYNHAYATKYDYDSLKKFLIEMGFKIIIIKFYYPENDQTQKPRFAKFVLRKN